MDSNTWLGSGSPKVRLELVVVLLEKRRIASVRYSEPGCKSLMYFLFVRSRLADAVRIFLGGGNRLKIIAIAIQN